MSQLSRFHAHGPSPSSGRGTSPHVRARAAIISYNPSAMKPTASPSSPQRRFWLPAFSLARRELVRFLRQRHRIIGALATPIVFWLLIGGGMGTSFRISNSGLRTQDSGLGFLHYFYPGTVLMILLFTAIFSTISIIEDRHEGFLQSVLVAPVSRMAIVLGKVLGGTILAAGQGLVFLALAPLVGFGFTPVSLLLAVLVILVLSFALTALGFCIAWRMRSTQGFHAIMNLFLMPMWFLSGAIFPADNAWVGLRYAVAINPLSYGLLALRQTMAWPGAGAGTFAGLFGITVGFAAAIFGLASLIATSQNDADLQ